MLILLAIILIPLVEITVFIVVGERIGVLATILAIVATATGGILLVRLQGFSTLRRAHEAMQRNEAPVAEAVDGALLALAGLLLIVPGFVTDLIGFLLLVPPIRRLLAARFLARGLARGVRMYGGVPPGGGPGGRRGGSGPVIEGEFEEVDDQERPRPHRELPRS